MRIYYGWYIVAAALVILTLVMGATMHSFGVFVRPISEEFGLSRADVNTGFILFNLGAAIWSPIIGKLLDRLPIRRVMLVCALLFGVSLATLGASRSLWLSALVLVVPLAIAVQGGVISANAIVARWFTQYRGRAMAIALFGMSLAGIVVTPTFAFGIEQYDWRTTLIAGGAVITVLLLAAIAIVREKPGPQDVESTTPTAALSDIAAPAADAKPLKAVTILAMPQFWAIGLSVALTLGFTSAIMVTLVPLAEGIGVPPTQASSLIAILSIAGFVGGLIAAWIADSVDRMLLLAVLFVLVGAVNIVLFFSHSFALLALSATLLGLCAGTASPAFHALVADRFGPTSFGTAYGLMVVLMTLCGALAVRYAGEVFDRTGSYSWLFLTITILQLVAAALMFGARMLSAPAIAHPRLVGQPEAS